MEMKKYVIPHGFEKDGYHDHGPKLSCDKLYWKVLGLERLEFLILVKVRICSDLFFFDNR